MEELKGVTPEQKITEISKEVSRIEEQSTKMMAVKSEKDVIKATEFLGVIKSRLTRVEELRQFYVKSPTEQVRKVNAKFKEQSNPLNAAFNTLKRVIGDYRMEQERKAEAEEKRLRELKEKEDAAKRKKGEVIEPATEVVIARPQTTIKSDSGKMTTKKVWKFEIENVNSIPLKYRKEILELAAKKGLVDTVIRKAVKSGQREIKGVRIYEDIDVSVSAL